MQIRKLNEYGVWHEERMCLMGVRLNWVWFGIESKCGKTTYAIFVSY